MPIEAPVGKFIPGWIAALQAMVPGDKARVWLPVEQAFNNQPGRPQGPVVFDLELQAIVPPPAAPTTAPPPGAKLVPDK